MKKPKTLANKVISVVLVCVLMSVLVSCGGNMTDETARQELERLLPISYEFNDIFWGKGLPVKEPDGKDRYKAVDDSCGYGSTSEILEKAKEVFSTEYLAGIQSAIFAEEEGRAPRYKDINGVLKIDTSNEGFDVKGNIIIESAKIKKQNRAMMILTADYEDGGSLEITLILENGKWFLNSPTY